MKLLLNALIKFACGLALVGLLVFLPAGTLLYPGAWLLLGLLFVPMLTAGICLFVASPDLLRRRLDSKEKQSRQKGVVGASGLMFLVVFVVSGLDHRFGWSRIPLWVTLAAAILFLLGYGLYGMVLRQNAYLSRTIRVEEGQQLVDTGLYRIVRHPMYFATLLLFSAMPLLLGSWYGLIPIAAYPPILIVRLKHEEALLCRELPGYRDYCHRVPHRLLPFLW